MQEELKEIALTFKTNVESVYNLMDFDKIVLEFAIVSLRETNERLKKTHMLSNPHLLLDKTIKALENININNSLKSKYEIMLNQCVVLLVSYFGSAIEDIFKTSLNYRLKQCKLGILNKEEIKITLGEMEEYNYNLSDTISEILTQKKDISFQDMQSISRAFKDYFEFSPDRTKEVNNIIMAQSSRHVIVHNGSIVSQRMVKQVLAATPRDLKSQVKQNEVIHYDKEEIIIVGESMIKYVNEIINQLYEWRKDNCIL